MPSEQPNQIMDKALKAHAQKRRADAPQLELDLATRNMLQAEVTRKLGKVPVAPAPRPRFVWWPKMIMGVAGAAAVAIAVILWNSSEPTRSRGQAGSAAVAFNAPASVAEKSKQTEQTLDATKKVEEPQAGVGGEFKVFAANEARSRALAKDKSESDLRLDDRSVAVNSAATVSDSLVAPTTPPPSLALETPLTLSAGGLSSHGVDTGTETSLSAKPGQPAPVSSPAATTRSSVSDQAVAANNRAAKLPTQQNFRFAQINNRAQYRVNLNSPPLPKVLTNFGLERVGTNIVVRDADGSIYSGKIISLNDNFAKRAPTTVQQQTFGGQNAIPEDSFSFRVSGYNRHLRQKIIFSGSLQNATAVTNALDNIATQQQATQNAAGTIQQQQSPAQNVQLNGKVQVGRNSEFEIEATPTK